jgi:hypothetical protein
MTRPVVLLFAVAAILLGGCACPRGAGRPFEPGRDNFAYGNELRWEYEFPKSGGVVTRKTDPPPEYSLRCFPMVRAAREFFYHAQFEPSQPKASEAEYRKLVKAVLHRNSRCPARPEERISIPGYANLHEFSAGQDEILKQECGGAARSFLQRGNWRMVFPVTRSGQRKTAERLAKEIKAGQLPIAHVYRFPNTTLNHAVLLYSAQEDSAAMTFSAYDPNDPDHVATLTFDRTSNAFLLERNRYFAGGAVRVYEVYRGLVY